MKIFSATVGSLFLFGIFLLGSGILFAHTASAQTAANSDIQSQISTQSQQITALQAEIAGYQKQLDTLGSQKQTLQSSLKSIDVTRQKTSAQISLIENQIAAANAQLQSLGGLIVTKQQQIATDKEAVAESIRTINNSDQIPFIATLFSSQSLVDVWKDVDAQVQLSEALNSDVQDLSSATTQLAGQQQQVSSTKDQLSSYSQSLVTQKGALDATAQAKQQLIAQTSSKQTSYQKLIATKKAQETSFENALSSLENSLKNVSASAVPKVGAGILAWPFSDAIMENCTTLQSALGNPYCITQYFGNTPFATANAAIYSGMGHDGVDIGVPIGTPVQAALSGTVADTGNTDLVKGCYSFGKWVMIAHANGLSTMYAHLSVIGVSPGQQVSTGDIIGYSGMTGYATGPHLHFGVYATAGVQFLTLNAFRGDTTTGCANATMPVAPKDAYLNPLSYLL
jgi:murein DD-endopeptidase MepM/ murein hydrolase activator NlpD